MKRERRPQPDDTIYLCLTERERKLLLDMLALPAELAERIAEATPSGAEPAYQFTLDELEELADAVAAEANHARSRRLERELDQLCDRIVDLLGVYSEDEGDDLLSFADIDFSEDAPPLAELGDVSALQLTRLLIADWDAPDGVIRISEGLAAEDLSEVPLLTNVRTFLDAVLAADGVKATVAKNLNRRFVRDMISVFATNPGDRPGVWLRPDTTQNEFDVWPVHIVRILCQLAGLVRCTKGVFRVTKKGKSLLAEAKAGALFALLFKTFYRKFNLDYCSPYTERALPQHFIPYFLYRVSRQACEWVTEDDFIAALIPPAASEEDTELEARWMAQAVQARVVRPLALFGLVDLREPEPAERGPRRYEARRAEVFARFLTFAIG